MTHTQTQNLILDLHEFKRGMCEYLRRLQAGEVEILIKRYRKPFAVVLSTHRSRLRREASEAEFALKAALAAQKRIATQRRRILINAIKTWPNTKAALLRSGDVV